MSVYLPPHKMAELAKKISDKNSVEYQQLAWTGLQPVCTLHHRVFSSMTVASLSTQHLERVLTVSLIRFAACVRTP